MSVAKLMDRIRGSNVKMKRRGDNGHPWRVPLCMSNGFDKILFILILAWGF